MFQPDLYFKPEDFEQYVKRYQCLCFHQFKLQPGESIDLVMEFEISPDIEIASEKITRIRDLASGNSLTSDAISLKIGYKIK
jgi:cytochrome c oxidase assembly protein Cox11